jgi:hypothetical protein
MDEFPLAHTIFFIPLNELFIHLYSEIPIKDIFHIGLQVFKNLF